MSTENRPIERRMQSIAARVPLVRLLIVAALGVAAVVALGLAAGGKSVSERDRAAHVVSLDLTAGGPPAGATASAGVTDSEAAGSYVQSRSQVTHATAVAPDKNTASLATGVSPGAPTDAEVKAELRQLQRGGFGGVAGARAVLRANGLAVAPRSAPARGFA